MTSKPEPEEHKLTLQVKALLWEKGQKALETARQSFQQEKIQSELLRSALEYFLSNWEDVVHPALLALTCEAVGGKAESTTQVGVAFVLLAGGADVHDDLIDQSTFKYSKPTVMGKYGKNIAILVGDALLFKGLYELHTACDLLPQTQKQAILELTRQAFFEISSAEAREASLHGKTDSSVAKEYLDMIKTKAAVSEATTKIGAILGGGSPEQIEALGYFGRIFSILATIRDEFIDVYELGEIRNRSEKECLPLPVLFTLKNPKKREKVLKLQKKGKITEKELECLLSLVINSKETEELKKEMRSITKYGIKWLRLVRRQKGIFSMMLKSMMEDL
jgi:geranylgeranyl diphosphate synthase type I